METNNTQEYYDGALATASFDVVSLVGYLIGVKREQFEHSRLSTAIYDELEAKDNAKTIHCLCTLRNAMMKSGDRILILMNDLRPLDNMPEIIDPEIFRFLSAHGIQVIKPNQKPLQYVMQLNQLIPNFLNACQNLFPLWLNWQYVRQLFIMPQGGKEDAVRKTIKNYSANINIFPFHCYINIPFVDKGNYLYHDAKFLNLIYENNHDVFGDYHRVRDAARTTRNKLYSFVTAHERIVLVVDCENSDPYQLTAVLRSIGTNCGSDLQHIQKIILYDDPHTINAWKILSSFVSIPLEHEMIERVNDRKSLVDIRMVAGTCREHYQNGVDAFLLVSSDSDYWGLISSLPDATFLTLLEHIKTSDSLLEALDSAGINYCFIDEFSGNLADIKVAALKKEMEEYLNRAVQFNVNDMMDAIFMQTGLQMTAGERQNFFDKYVKTLKLQIGIDGNASVQIAQ